MLVFLLAPNTHVEVPVIECPTVEFEVRSDPIPVVVRVLDDINKQLFDDQKPFEHLGPTLASPLHEFEEDLGDGPWHLLVLNETEETVAVGIEMKDPRFGG